tara:strand:+ start:278 stop:517 length:240 start_codon:yes stop_codon:yes gene_type:complete
MNDNTLKVLETLIYRYYGYLFMPFYILFSIIIFIFFYLGIICGLVAGVLFLLLTSFIYNMSIIFRLMMKNYFENIQQIK